MKLLSRGLVARIAPISYLVALQSVAIGIEYTFFQNFSDVQHGLLYQYSVIGGLDLWGILLLVGSLAVFCGMLLKNRTLVELGAMTSFILWLFALITYYSHGAWIVGTISGIFHLLFFGYVYLAASLKVLWDH